MSRLGKLPIVLPSGVEATYTDNTLTIKGPKGSLFRTWNKYVTIVVEGNQITLTPVEGSDESAAMWGTFAAHVNNMVEGVTKGFEKKLQIEGVGYRAEMKGNTLVLQVGYSHPVELPVPEGLQTVIEKNIITITGTDKEVLGQYAADIRDVRPPEPYKGKGIRYQGEYIIRKQGKKAA